MKKAKLSTFATIILLLVLVLSLLAPFTFLKPAADKNSFNQEEQTVAKNERVNNETITGEAASTSPTLINTPDIAPKIVAKKVEQPLHSVFIPDFAKINDVKEKKRQFFAFIKPAIISENNKLLAIRTQLAIILEKLSLEEPLSQAEHTFLKEQAKKYKVKATYSELHITNELLTRIDIVPIELVLVQAANESAWGTSRFARIGLNFFGIWCYRKGCGLIPEGRNVGAKHEVAAFDSVEHSVSRYLYTLNTNNAYTTFRLIRAQLRANEQPLTPEILATGLLSYSQRGADYILDLTAMIRHNRRYF